MQPTHWQQALADSFNNVQQLCAYLGISPEEVNVAPQFALRVPRGFAACMRSGDPHDPLLRQVLPSTLELRDYPGYTVDPVGDLAAYSARGIIHKYHGRALLITTGGCAIHCRYCFRQHFPYSDLQLTKSHLTTAIAYIAAHPELSEIILSGGDPLLLTDQRLSELFDALSAVPHVQRIRLHSRIPVVLPERITSELIKIFTHRQQRIVLVLHANHANELSVKVAESCETLAQANITLLNQSVLLKGVNDQVGALVALSERLFACRVLPYYLHLLDKASGTGHFEVSEQQALSLYQQLQIRLPGYLVPKLVREQAGAAYKLSVF